MIKFKPIIPSSLLKERDDSKVDYARAVMNDVTIKSGVIVDIYEINDDRNFYKIGPEYEVIVTENNNNKTYYNCLTFDSFGGKGDFLNKKLRKADNVDKTSDEVSTAKHNGSNVLILCLDGNSTQGIIVGALPHAEREEGVLSEDKGVHLEGEYNGVNWQVNKDGELILTYKSKTDNDGKPQDTTAGGTFVKIDKDGSVDINTGKDSEYIRIDKPNKDVGLNAGNKIGLTAKDSIGFNAGDDLNMKIKKDWIAKAEGKAALTIGSEFTLEAASQVQIVSPLLKVQADSLATVEAPLINLKGDLVLVGGPGAPALTIQTQFQGIGNLGAPVLSIPIGPFSSKVFIAP